MGRRVRSRARWTIAWCVLTALLVVDSYFVVGSLSIGRVPAEYERLLLVRVHRSFRRPECAVVREGNRLVLRYGDDAKDVPESARVYSEFRGIRAGQQGIWTLFMTTWPHSAFVDVPDDLDYELETRRVLEQYATRVAAEYPWVPRDYVSWAKSGRRSTTVINYWLLTHDILYTLVLVAWLGVTVLVPYLWLAPMPRRERRVARGQCADCGYDLRGLSAGRCPECGHEGTVPLEAK